MRSINILFRLYEINLGDIKSFPKSNINLNEETIKKLEDEKYKYEVKLIGRKIEKDEKINTYRKILLK
jgi:hypothetical protein